MADGRHGPEIRYAAPQPIASADVRRMKRARFPAEEALCEIVRVPQIEIADLRALHTYDAEELSPFDAKGTRVAWRHNDLILLHNRLPYGFQHRDIGP